MKSKETVKREFISELKSKLAKRGYRADLSLVTAARCTEGAFNAEIKFNKQLGYPTEDDLLAIVAGSYPEHEINWELLNVDDGSNVITLTLEPAMEVLPISSLKEIPKEFKAIGTGIYKKSVDSGGLINEVWTLKKTDDGLALFRNQSDLEVTAESDDTFHAGDVVLTPKGPGIVKRQDDMGNFYVQIGAQTRLVAAMDIKKYNIEKEKSKLQDYFEAVYGREFAQDLVRTQEEIVKDTEKSKKK